MQIDIILRGLGRAHCSKKYPQVFREPEAEHIVDMVDYDFDALNYKDNNYKKFNEKMLRTYIKSNEKMLIVI